MFARAYSEMRFLTLLLDYSMCAWILRSLGRRLRFFGIKYTDYVTVKSAVKEKLQGPGKLLGYRAMQQKLL